MIRKDGVNVSEQFIKGAKEVLSVAKLMDVKMALLKARSPSCGKGNIYDGTFSGTLKNGNGVTTDLLQENGVKVITEDEIDCLRSFLDINKSK